MAAGFSDSNTSHVLIYRKGEKRLKFTDDPFKYISCSYLSRIRLSLNCNCWRIQIHLMFLFIIFFLHTQKRT